MMQAKPRSKAFFDPEKISSHVHRIGHHFPLEIIDLACRKFNYRYSEGRGLRRTRRSPVSGPAYVERGIANYEQRQGLHSRPVTDSEHKEHIRGAIREIFPKIPDADLTSIVNHAFEEVKSDLEMPYAMVLTRSRGLTEWVTLRSCPWLVAYSLPLWHISATHIPSMTTS